MSAMIALRYALLGILQGITEFLPVSSSGHLLLAQKLMGMGENDTEALLIITLMHAGTLAAVLLVFLPDWLDMLRKLPRSRMLGNLLLASLPALAVKMFAGDLIDSLFGGWFLGPAFLITAFFLVLAQRLGGGVNDPRSDTVAPRNALAMGVMQGIALVPGISRSGSTLLGGIASGLTRDAAVRFSFMMSAPAILASLVTEGAGALRNGEFESLNVTGTVIGVLLAGVSGYLAIKFMLNLIRRMSFYLFAVYLTVLGAAVILLQLAGAGGF
jgi:undecaprenyl-diphosphatase